MLRTMKTLGLASLGIVTVEGVDLWISKQNLTLPNSQDLSSGCYIQEDKDKTN